MYKLLIYLPSLLLLQMPVCPTQTLTESLQLPLPPHLHLTAELRVCRLCRNTDSYTLVCRTWCSACGPARRFSRCQLGSAWQAYSSSAFPHRRCFTERERERDLEMKLEHLDDVRNTMLLSKRKATNVFWPSVFRACQRNDQFCLFC